MVGGDDAYEADAEKEFNAFLVELLGTGDITGAAEGITKLVLDKGQNALSDKQRYVFERDVVEKYKGVCDECHDQVSWSEAYEFYHSPGRCSTCQTRYEKFMAED